MTVINVHEKAIDQQERINDIITKLIKRDPFILIEAYNLVSGITNTALRQLSLYPKTEKNSCFVIKLYAGLEQTFGAVIINGDIEKILAEENMSPVSLGRKMYNETLNYSSTDEVLGQMAQVQKNYLFYIFAYLSIEKESEFYLTNI